MKHIDFNEFDPLAWANTGEQANTRKTTYPASHSAPTTDEQQITAVANILVSRGIDLTNDYNDWLRLGFALVNGMGEAGRGIFHQLSRMNGKYNANECDVQYNHCLRSRGCGTTIKTFFQMAKTAGINLSEVARDAIRQSTPAPQVCATCAIVPTSTNTEKREKSTISGTFKGFVPSGTMAQVAQVEQTVPDKTQASVANCGQTFSDELLREDLPDFLHPVLDSQDNAVGRDKMLLGTLNLISGILPKSIYSIYDRRRIYAPLYNIIYGRFATSKGDLEAVKQLVMPIKQEMRRAYEAEKEDYDRQHALWEAQGKKERGPEPPEPVLCSPYVAANSSASAVYRGLDANGGWGLMFETEADTLTNMLSKSEYGDYSDLLRKAHHHETVAMVRVSDKVNIEINDPRLSVFLTCTGSQLPLLLPASNVSNGLASRFLFYALPDAKVEFRDVFEGCDKPIEDLYKGLGEQLLPLYHALRQRSSHPIQFLMSKAQQREFVSTFDAVLREQFSMLGDGIQGFIFRLALECYRYAMILSMLRRLSERAGQESLFDDDEQAVECDERDFHTALILINCLVNHTGRVYAVLGTTDNDPFGKIAEQLSGELRSYYKALPDKEPFKASLALEVAQQLQIPRRTANRMLGDMVAKFQLLGHPSRGVYVKNNVQQKTI